MQPFEVKLAYNGESWMTLPLAVGHNEVGDADDPDMVSSPEAATILAQLGFPEPGPVPCMRLEHQIAQKLHAASGPESERAHDLIDLQIAVAGGGVDYEKTREVCADFSSTDASRHGRQPSPRARAGTSCTPRRPRTSTSCPPPTRPSSGPTPS